MGFSIRKEYGHRSKSDKSIITSRFVCSKQGLKKIDLQVSKPKNPRAETRTNCPAQMGIKIMVNGQYWCHDFIEEHNHDLHTLATSYMMLSQRKISEIHAFRIDLTNDSGLRPKAIFDCMGRQVGGIENLGHTKQDQKNYLRTKWQRELVYYKVANLLRYFEKQTRANSSFAYSLQLDSGEKIANIFWANPRMIIDYALFGDVITFDTIFDTNKEYRPFGVFAGFNHHRRVYNDEVEFEKAWEKLRIDYEVADGSCCRKFETYDILCCHAIKILDRLDIKMIPESYVLRRWTRTSRNIEMKDNEEKIVEEDVLLDYTQRYSVLSPLCVKLVSQASTSDEGYTLAHKNAHELSKQLQNLQCNEENLDESGESHIVQLENK
ncbi:protein FAR1-RELATED SEQUENCE 5-like [Telopea speciosissima]|uniref:protein FAR1-RELATED SEQUENCE 5-like n=1 Tax=Telopea speciosissima TaxID=54955 RepID=UPI001CC82325|nr:protein FAR1-RELATED SEQUENCE 5-like [Telopea speciosissima]